MTTGIQLSFYDKEYGHSVLYATDSRATLINLMDCIVGLNDDVEKITMTPKFIIANSGIDFSCNRNSTEKSMNIIENIVKSKRQSKKKMKNLINILTTEIEKVSNVYNTTAYTVFENSKLKSGIVNENRQEPLIQCNVFGSGENYAREFLEQELKPYLNIKTKKLEGSIFDMTKVATGALKYAAYKDGYTGGKANFAAATEKGMLEIKSDIKLDKI